MVVHSHMLPYKRTCSSRKQQDGESLQEFSHALFSLMEKVVENAPVGMPNSAILLRDQFIEHVNDAALRRELKQVVRFHPEYTLLVVRGEAIRWEREGGSNGKGEELFCSIPVCHAKGARATGDYTS